MGGSREDPPLAGLLAARQLFFSVLVNVHMQNWSKLQSNATPCDLRVEFRRLCTPTVSLHFPTVLHRGYCVGQGWRFKGDESFAATVLEASPSLRLYLKLEASSTVAIT